MYTSPTEPLASAWQPLPDTAWDAEAARHLLRRAGWAARPEEAAQAVRDGLAATLDRLFTAAGGFFPQPSSVATIAAEAPGYAARRRAAADEPTRRAIEREEREQVETALQDMSLQWLDYARQPDTAAFAKWTLFLSDIYVVASDKVRNPGFIWRHYDTLGRMAFGSAPALTKAVSRSAAMLVYLDLNQSQRTAPNENFARELFELFVLGEGNYTERDVKESARAFTGYRVLPGGRFVFAPRQHDDGMKTVFGQTGPYRGDDVIDLAYSQRAAGAFVPHEIAKFYLSDRPLPREYLYALGDLWRTEGGYNLGWLARRFFGSRLFFSPEFRGNFIKSPIQYYVGLLQDLDVAPIPVPRFTLNPLRQMGQVLFNPPNVRGWVGGRAWINSTSLAARRNLAELLFIPLEDAHLNADEVRAVAACREAGSGPFSVSGARLLPFVSGEPDAAAALMERQFLNLPAEPAFHAGLSRYLAAAPDDRFRRVRRAAITLLETPEYQLC